MTLWFPIHMQLSTATHIITHTHCAARSINRNTHIRPEGVAWAALSYAGPRTSPPLFGGYGVCGTRSGTDLPPPSTQRHHACTDHSPLAIMVVGVEWLEGFFGEAACGDIYTVSEAVIDTTLNIMALPAVWAYLDSIGLSDPDLLTSNAETVDGWEKGIQAFEAVATCPARTFASLREHLLRPGHLRQGPL